MCKTRLGVICTRLLTRARLDLNKNLQEGEYRAIVQMLLQQAYNLGLVRGEVDVSRVSNPAQIRLHLQFP